MALAAGDLLGPYEILAPLGARGTWARYIARAIRGLAPRGRPPSFSQDQFSGTFPSAKLAPPPRCIIPIFARCTKWGRITWRWNRLEGVPLRGPLSLQETLRLRRMRSATRSTTRTSAPSHPWYDLKPANILVTKEGIKLQNFGLASPGASGTASGREACRRVLRYLRLRGRAVRNADGARRIAEDRRPVQPAALEIVLQKCLQRDPAARYQSAAELKQALAGAAHPRGFRREYIVGAASIVMLVAGLALLVMQFPSNQRLLR